MKFAFVGVQSASLMTFRAAMFQDVIDNGHSVLAIAPEDDPSVRAALTAMHVDFAAVPLHRAGLNPIRDAAAFIALTRLLRRHGPDAILLAAAKPVGYGSIAARLAGVPMRAAMITGVGSALGGGSGTRRRQILAFLVRGMYAAGLRQITVVFFQNPDDERMFRSLGLVDDRHRTVQIGGSGVDIDHFAAQALPPTPVTFLMIARLLRDKGLREYAAAARQARLVHPDARFQLLGPLDPNPEGITQAELEAIQDEGVIEYLGTTTDVRPFLAAAHVCVLPSYREGTPRSILEAMAMGRAVLTTDVPGCRETVEGERNGLLVAARDANALAAGMIRMISHPERLAAMGLEGRRIVERRYDVRIVDHAILDAMGLLAPAELTNGSKD